MSDCMPIGMARASSCQWQIPVMRGARTGSQPQPVSSNTDMLQLFARSNNFTKCRKEQKAFEEACPPQSS